MIRKQSPITRLMAINYSAPTLMIRTHVCAGALMLLMYAMIGSATAGQTITVYAAGSLKSALSDLAESYESATGNKVSARYGASGLLKDEISKGAKADVFASANMEHPQALHDQNKSGPVIRFARNTLCALVKPGLKVDSANLLDFMLDPGVKLGTSTPKADPSGDYAFEVFSKADAIRPRAQAVLAQKALQLTGAEGVATYRRRRQRNAPGRAHSLWVACRGGPRRYFPDLLYQRSRCTGGKPGTADCKLAGQSRGWCRLWFDSTQWFVPLSTAVH